MQLSSVEEWAGGQTNPWGPAAEDMVLLSGLSIPVKRFRVRMSWISETAMQCGGGGGGGGLPARIAALRIP